MIEPIYSLIGNAIRDLRKEMGMNQFALAEAVGLSRGSIANIETGRQRILVHDLDTFAKAFGMKTTELIEIIWP